MLPVSVVIPVGPDPKYLEYLPECIQSVADQNYNNVTIIFIDDSMDGCAIQLTHIIKHIATLDSHIWTLVEVVNKDFMPVALLSENMVRHFEYYKTPWNAGVADAFNFGIALSESNLVFMLGSDDKMLPGCLEACVAEYEKRKIEGWYNVTIENATDGIMQIPNNTAMVTKELWAELGGFPPSAGVGAPDALLLSIMLKHMPERIIQVKPGTPLCWLREGEHQDTRKNGWTFADEIVSIRNKETNRWKPRK